MPAIWALAPTPTSHILHAHKLNYTRRDTPPCDYNSRVSRARPHDDLDAQRLTAARAFKTASTKTMTLINEPMRDIAPCTLQVVKVLQLNRHSGAVQTESRASHQPAPALRLCFRFSCLCRSKATSHPRAIFQCRRRTCRAATQSAALTHTFLNRHAALACWSGAESEKSESGAKIMRP